MANDTIHVKRVIQRCGCDTILPLTLVYIFYVILHGHLSPGGGFQGGVLMVAAVLLIHLGHGHEITTRILPLGAMRKVEGFAVTMYIAIAFAGIAMGANFCSNFLYMNGNPGDLISSGTISLMDEAVGLNVLTGVTILVLSLNAILLDQDIDFVQE